MPLTDVKIKNTKPADKTIKLTDGHGLILEIRPNGSRFWRYRYRIDGRENMFAVGDYPAMSLAEARTARDTARDLVKAGVHPAHQRQTERLVAVTEGKNTFKAVADEWVAKAKIKWSPYYLNQVERGLKADINPYIGNLPIKAVTAKHLLEILQRIEKRGAMTVALLVRQWCSAVFRYGTATLRCDGDPAQALRGAIHRPKPNHAKALSRAEIQKFMTALDENGGYRTTIIALRLALLLACRTVELRKAEWAEFDLKDGMWRIPASRMKMGEQHQVPLSKQAVALLNELKTHTGGQQYLFPNLRTPKTCMTATTLNRALERMGFAGKEGIGFAAHGFRATFSTMMHEAGHPTHIIERALAHAERNKVKAAYNHASYMKERTTLMQQWADLIDAIIKDDGKVICIKQGKAT